MVFVTVSETYDLSTKPKKMSIIGVHTPKKEIIQKTYPGLLMNCKYIRIVKQDVTLACASMLPVDPTRVGVSDGQVAPQDMFNPILYKAVSNDSMSTVEARLHGLKNQSSAYTVIDGQSVQKSDDMTQFADDFNVYYSLLADREGFKTAHPQQGLSMKGLVPLVFEKYYNVGQNKIFTATGQESNEYPALKPGSSGLNLGSEQATAMRGRPHAMPKFNTTYITDVSGAVSGNFPNCLQNGMGDGGPTNSQTKMPDIMPVYTACIIMPPCQQNQIYYRMVVRTTLEFTDVRPIQDITSFAQMNSVYGPIVYNSDYATQSKSMTVSLGMVDAEDAEIEKIMEGR